MEFLPQFAVSLASCFGAEGTAVKNEDVLEDGVRLAPNP